MLYNSIKFGGRTFLTFKEIALLSILSTGYKQLSLWCFSRIQKLHYSPSKINQGELVIILKYLYSRLNPKKIKYIGLNTYPDDMQIEFMSKFTNLITLATKYIYIPLVPLLSNYTNLESMCINNQLCMEYFQILQCLPNIRVIKFLRKCTKKSIT